MNYQLFIAEEALKQLRALPKDLRKRIGEKLSILESDFAGDIRKLAGAGSKYRLRSAIIACCSGLREIKLGVCSKR